MADLARMSLRAAADKGAVLHLKDPATNDPLFDGDEPVTITLLGANSQAMIDKAKEIERRRVEGETIDDAQAGAEQLAALTVAWSGISVNSDKPLECTFENAVKIYLDPHTEWVVEQIGPFCRSRRNFVGNRQKG